MRRSLLPLLLALGCAGVQPAADIEPVAAEVPHLDERALLLLLVDQQLYDPLTVSRARALGPELRLELARALARTGNPRAREVLESLLVDEDLEVRRQAAFGLGVLGDGEAVPVLVRAARDGDEATGRLAVEALAKLEAPIGRVVEALASLPPAQGWSRLAPALYRFPAEAALPTVRRALIEGGSSTYTDAMYALARNPQESSLPILRELLTDPDPWLRGLAARAVGRVGDGSDLTRLLPLVDGPEPGEVIQALRSARRLVAAGRSAPPAEWRARLLALLEDPREGVRLTAIETCGAWLRDPEVGAALLERYSTTTGRERELALLALAAAAHPRAVEIVGQAGGSADRLLRQRAAAAAGLLENVTVLERLVEDSAPAVRATAFAELLRIDGERAGSWATRALEDADPVVRSSAFEWAKEHPIVPAVELTAALGGMGQTDVVESQLAALAALEARALAVSEEREAIVAALALLAREADLVLRRRAGEALTTLGEIKPPLGGVVSQRGLGVYRDLVRRAWTPRTVRLSTTRGEIDLRLECPLAPLTCVNFLQLVGHGFYDGLTFHRVVPDFVIQGGDPRGDGYGGPGYMIRDEINRLRYERGRVGMALAGPHTGGSQFFITLSPQPHLDGGYTIFGSVIAGDEVLDQITQGDEIISAREISPVSG